RSTIGSVARIRFPGFLLDAKTLLPTSAARHSTIIHPKEHRTMTRSSRNRFLHRNAQRSERSANMGATRGINEAKPSEVHMDSKHIDKIIRMASEIDRDNMPENERAHTELGNQFSSLLFMVALRLVRREPYVLISSDQNILSCFRFLAER